MNDESVQLFNILAFIHNSSEIRVRTFAQIRNNAYNWAVLAFGPFKQPFWGDSVNFLWNFNFYICFHANGLTDFHCPQLYQMQILGIPQSSQKWTELQEACFPMCILLSFLPHQTFNHCPLCTLPQNGLFHPVHHSTRHLTNMLLPPPPQIPRAVGAPDTVSSLRTADLVFSGLYDAASLHRQRNPGEPNVSSGHFQHYLSVDSHCSNYYFFGVSVAENCLLGLKKTVLKEKKGCWNNMGLICYYSRLDRLAHD